MSQGLPPLPSGQLKLYPCYSFLLPPLKHLSGRISGQYFDTLLSLFFLQICTFAQTLFLLLPKLAPICGSADFANKPWTEYLATTPSHPSTSLLLVHLNFFSWTCISSTTPTHPKSQLATSTPGTFLPCSLRPTNTDPRNSNTPRSPSGFPSLLPTATCSSSVATLRQTRIQI